MNESEGKGEARFRLFALAFALALPLPVCLSASQPIGAEKDAKSGKVDDDNTFSFPRRNLHEKSSQVSDKSEIWDLGSRKSKISNLM